MIVKIYLKQKLKNEQKEWSKKITSLKKFIERGNLEKLDSENKALLIKELEILEAYNEVLIKKIALTEAE